jgi:hypothetical protein
MKATYRVGIGLVAGAAVAVGLVAWPGPGPSARHESPPAPVVPAPVAPAKRDIRFESTLLPLPTDPAKLAHARLHEDCREIYDSSRRDYARCMAWGHECGEAYDGIWWWADNVGLTDAERDICYPEHREIADAAWDAGKIDSGRRRLETDAQFDAATAALRRLHGRTATGAPAPAAP